MSGAHDALDAFVVAVAVTVSLMFVTLLLAAGMLALEREEHAFGRLVRGLVSRIALLAEKIALAALCSFAVTPADAVRPGGVSGSTGRARPRGCAALAGGALGFAAMGVAIGGARARGAGRLAARVRCCRCRSRSSRSCPSGAVADGLYDVITGVSALFPFKPALRALDAAINGGDARPCRCCTCWRSRSRSPRSRALALRRFG